MRSGCFSYILRLGTAVLSAFLLALGVLVLLFGAFLESSGAVRALVTLVLALGAVYLFARVGKDILRDLRKENPGNEETPPK